MAVDNPKNIDHDEMVEQWTAYSKALPEKPGVQAVRQYISDKMSEMRKMRDNNAYTKGACLKIVSSMMSVADQKLIDSYIHEGLQSSEMSKLAVKSLRIRVQNIAQVKTKIRNKTKNNFRQKPRNRKNNLALSIQRRKRVNTTTTWRSRNKTHPTKNR